MCFTSGHTSDHELGDSSLTDGLRAKLLPKSGSKRNKSTKSKYNSDPYSTTLPEAYAGVKSPQAVAKIVALTKATTPTRSSFKGSTSRASFSRLDALAEKKGTQNTAAMTNSLSPEGVGAQRFVSNSGQVVPKDQLQSEKLVSNSEIAANDARSERFLSYSGVAPKHSQSEQFASDSDSRPNLDKKAFIPAQFVPKINTKQVKGMMKGMGKELRRAASTVGEKLPNNFSKKKSKAERERLELLEAELQRPQVRHADEIKKAYGHTPTVDNASQAAMITRDKLHERGEKISAIQRRTTELEADAANFSSLAQELAKKMESKKWYEIR